jgi:thioredoxin reductase (NADPH)
MEAGTGSVEWDAVIIGGGPAGLTAAIYLGRFRRSVLVIDAGDSRARRIPISRNHPGFPDGIVGAELVARTMEQASRYGAVLRSGKVRGLRREDGVFKLDVDGEAIRAPFVLVATGVVDNDPHLPGVERAIERGLLRICPICDAYEVIDEKIGVIGDGSHGVREAQFLRNYSDDVTLIHIRPDTPLSADDHRTLHEARVDLIECSINRVVIENDAIRALDIGGKQHRFDVIYAALGITPQSQLARQAGAFTDEANCLRVSAHQETSVDGLYAAGDLVRGLNQISVAEGEGAIAATDIHNRLRLGAESR